MLRPTGTSIVVLLVLLHFGLQKTPEVKVRRSQRAGSGELSGRRRITHPTVTHAHTRTHTQGAFKYTLHTGYGNWNKVR